MPVLQNSTRLIFSLENISYSISVWNPNQTEEIEFSMKTNCPDAFHFSPSKGTLAAQKRLIVSIGMRTDFLEANTTVRKVPTTYVFYFTYHAKRWAPDVFKTEKLEGIIEWPSNIKLTEAEIHETPTHQNRNTDLDSDAESADVESIGKCSLANKNVRLPSELAPQLTENVVRNVADVQNQEPTSDERDLAVKDQTKSIKNDQTKSILPENYGIVAVTPQIRSINQNSSQESVETVNHAKTEDTDNQSQRSRISVRSETASHTSAKSDREDSVHRPEDNISTASITLSQVLEEEIRKDPNLSSLERISVKSEKFYDTLTSRKSLHEQEPIYEEITGRNLNFRNENQDSNIGNNWDTKSEIVYNDMINRDRSRSIKSMAPWMERNIIGSKDDSHKMESSPVQPVNPVPNREISSEIQADGQEDFKWLDRLIAYHSEHVAGNQGVQEEIADEEATEVLTALSQNKQALMAEHEISLLLTQSLEEAQLSRARNPNSEYIAAPESRENNVRQWVSQLGSDGRGSQPATSSGSSESGEIRFSEKVTVGLPEGKTVKQLKAYNRKLLEQVEILRSKNETMKDEQQNLEKKLFVTHK